MFGMPVRLGVDALLEDWRRATSASRVLYQCASIGGTQHNFNEALDRTVQVQARACEFIPTNTAIFCFVSKVYLNFTPP